jgi:hypothetical protein
MMVSTGTVLHLLLALGIAVAAPAYYSEEGMLGARSLSYPETRSIMLGHQEFSRGYEGDVVMSARDLSLLGVRADGKAKEKEEYEEQPKKPKSKKKAKLTAARNDKDKETVHWQKKLNAAGDAVSYDGEEISKDFHRK